MKKRTIRILIIGIAIAVALAVIIPTGLAYDPDAAIPDIFIPLKSFF